jgi:hypothetical protein
LAGLLLYPYRVKEGLLRRRSQLTFVQNVQFLTKRLGLPRKIPSLFDNSDNWQYRL